MERICIKCGQPLSQYNPGRLCFACQKEKIETMFNADEAYYDANDMASILQLKNPESVRRAARKGKLPPRVPGIRKCLWPKDVIDNWIKSGHQLMLSNSEEDRAILITLKLGWPIDKMTLYGHDVGYLISELKELGYLDNDEPKT